SLNEEINRVKLYLFEGNERPDDKRVTGNDRINLRSYLDVLQNYQTAINEVSEDLDWDRSEDAPLLARAEYVKFTGEKNPFNFQMKSDITIAYDQDNSDDKGTSREEFLELESRRETL